MEKALTKPMKVILIICAVVGFMSIFVISCSMIIVNNAEKKEKAQAEEKFIKSVEDVLSMYGSEIEKYYFNNDDLNVYVDENKWNNSSESTKTEFMSEVTRLINSSASSSKILEFTDIDIYFFTTDRKNVGTFKLKERK